MPRFERRLELPVPSEVAFAWHERPGAFERLAPTWERMTVLRREGGIRDGDVLEFALHKGPLRLRWRAVHRGYEPGQCFVDVAERCPFRRWRHEHRVAPAPGGSVLTDTVDYELPLGALGRLFGGGVARRLLERMFRQRHQRTRSDLARHQAFADRPRLRVAISGASGLLGAELSAFLTTGGHTVSRCVRQPSEAADAILWSPADGRVDADDLAGHDAVVHLAGESVAGRWTAAKKRRILESRRVGTRLLCEALAALEAPPRVLVAASAIGIYGDRGDEALDEDSAPGAGFLAEVCREWEAARAPARAAGIRVVNLRIGIVLSARGGALPRLVTPVSLGVGGPVGGGRQVMSWIAMDDVIGAIHHCLLTDELAGAVNAVAPHPQTNRELTRTLGRVLRRPTILPVPGFVLRLLLGEFAQEALLAGQRVAPGKLLESGFRFDFPELEPALRHELGRA